MEIMEYKNIKKMLMKIIEQQEQMINLLIMINKK